jgi:hypothetical protein
MCRHSGESRNPFPGEYDFADQAMAALFFFRPPVAGKARKR